MKITYLNPNGGYNLRLEDLEPCKIYQCDNGTIVVVTYSGPRPINIENGIGGYAPKCKFKLLRNVRLEFETNSEGESAHE